jgi:ribosomal protein S18 acetylase RimI-like enzyme
MQLLPMNEIDFAFWSRRSKESYIQDKMRANGYTRSEAEQIAEEDFQTMLHEGLHTHNNFLLKIIKDEADVGFLWFCIRHEKAFLCDFIIEEPYRRKGIGQEAMRSFEGVVKRLGLKKMGLHVFGFNTGAIELYKSLGFVITDMTMEKFVK